MQWNHNNSLFNHRTTTALVNAILLIRIPLDTTRQEPTLVLCSFGELLYLWIVVQKTNWCKKTTEPPFISITNNPSGSVCWGAPRYQYYASPLLCSDTRFGKKPRPRVNDWRAVDANIERVKWSFTGGGWRSVWPKLGAHFFHITITSHANQGLCNVIDKKLFNVMYLEEVFKVISGMQLCWKRFIDIEDTLIILCLVDSDGGRRI